MTVSISAIKISIVNRAQANQIYSLTKLENPPTVFSSLLCEGATNHVGKSICVHTSFPVCTASCVLVQSNNSCIKLLLVVLSVSETSINQIICRIVLTMFGVSCFGIDSQNFLQNTRLPLFSKFRTIYIFLKKKIHF